MKIAPNELRIGNYLSDGKGGHREVLSFHPDWYEHGYGVTLFRDAEPIPLTEEWLLKLGWEKTSFGSEKAFRCRGQLIYEEWIDGVYHVRFHATNKRIQHVHNLMNLYFALTGKELTIKH